MPDAEPEAELMRVFAEAFERTNLLDRAAYLDAACAGNLPLRERVEARASCPRRSWAVPGGRFRRVS